MVSFLLFSSVMHILSDGHDAQIRPYKFQKLEAKRPENETSGKINPSVGGLTYNICGHFPFPFSTSTSSSKYFFTCTTCKFKFWKFTMVHISEIKESGTCQI